MYRWPFGSARDVELLLTWHVIQNPSRNLATPRDRLIPPSHYHSRQQVPEYAFHYTTSTLMVATVSNGPDYAQDMHVQYSSLGMPTTCNGIYWMLGTKSTDHRSERVTQLN